MRPIIGLCALLASGCVASLGFEDLDVAYDDALAEVLDSCIYREFHDRNLAPAITVTLDYPDGTYWLFTHYDPYNLIPDNDSQRSPANASHSGAVARGAPWGCGGELDLLLEPDGRPSPVLALTDDEEAFFANDPQGRFFRLFPLSGYVVGS